MSYQDVIFLLRIIYDRDEISFINFNKKILITNVAMLASGPGKPKNFDKKEVIFEDKKLGQANGCHEGFTEKFNESSYRKSVKTQK